MRGARIVISGRDRAKFGAPARTLLGRRVCATAVIRIYRGRPEMIINEPAELRR